MPNYIFFNCRILIDYTDFLDERVCHLFVICILNTLTLSRSNEIEYEHKPVHRRISYGQYYISYN